MTLPIVSLCLLSLISIANLTFSRPTFVSEVIAFEGTLNPQMASGYPTLRNCDDCGAILPPGSQLVVRIETPFRHLSNLIGFYKLTVAELDSGYTSTQGTRPYSADYYQLEISNDLQIWINLGIRSGTTTLAIQNAIQAKDYLYVRISTPADSEGVAIVDSIFSKWSLNN